MSGVRQRAVERQSARIVGSRTLRPDRNDVPLGSIAPKNFVERLDFFLGDDDRSSPDPPAARLCQEPFLLDHVAFSVGAFDGSVAVNGTQKFRSSARVKVARLVTHQSQRL